MLAEAPLPIATDRALIDQLIESAGWAPFHRPAAQMHRGELSSIVPWRCYSLDAATCRKLREYLVSNGDESKLPKMLAAADALIVVTWLPNPPKSDIGNQLFEPTVDNMEHLAAASAAVQNLLIAATAHDVANYWSSGGALREDAIKKRLGIPAAEILLGAIFLFPQKCENVDIAPGKLRDLRGTPNTWSRWVELD